ncbi:MAG: hypothetical protein ACTSUK_04770, partial [Promethearchaeota archaeon]
GDTYGDGVEVLSGTNPLDAGDYPGSNLSDDTSTDDTSTDDTSTDDTSTDDTSTDDTSTDDTSTDDTSTDDINPFVNIPGYTPTIFMMIFISTIGILIIKKRK